MRSAAKGAHMRRVLFSLARPRALLDTLVALAALSVTSSARAQEWPEDLTWHALRCGLVPSFDPRRDEAAAVGERDVVGDTNAPALFAAEDLEFVYFRMRVDTDPIMG